MARTANAKCENGRTRPAKCAEIEAQLESTDPPEISDQTLLAAVDERTLEARRATALPPMIALIAVLMALGFISLLQLALSTQHRLTSTPPRLDAARTVKAKPVLDAPPAISTEAK